MTNTVFGAIVGDIIGSVYEHTPTKTTAFQLFKEGSTFTDDTVLTLAVAQWMVKDVDHTHEGLIEEVKKLCRQYPNAGYGWNFYCWMRSATSTPYNSWANGSAMRVSPVALYASSIEEVLDLAKISAEITHNHPDGIKGAQAIATSVFLCKNGVPKEDIREYVEKTFGYDLHRTINEIRPTYKFDVSCNGSVPEAIIAFLDGNDFEEVVRLAISLGGDADTLAAIAGSIAACCYPIPEEIVRTCNVILPPDLRLIQDGFIKYISNKI